MKLLSTVLLLTATTALANTTADLLSGIGPVPVKESQIKTLASEGFTSLLQGNTLQGWEIRGSKATYKVENGEIIGTAKNLRGNSFLCTKKTYSDFIYVFQMRFDDLTGNSGCMFRALYDKSKNRVYGYQCEHDNKFRAWTAGIYDESRRGWLFPTQNPVKPHGHAFSEQGRRIFKPADWNTIVIKCVGNRIQTWMNGELRVDFTDTHEEHTTPEGFFGLQVHGGASCNVRWRNLFVKELKK